MECYKCGITDQKALLYEVISPKGIVAVCRKCSFGESLPLIKKSRGESEEPKLSVHDRLSKIAGIKPGNKYVKSSAVSEQEKELQELIKKNIKINSEEENRIKQSLVKNFQWVMTRIRRARHLTQKELSQEIAEPLDVIRILEAGRIPSGGQRALLKIQSFLNVRLFNNPERGMRPQSLDLSNPASKGLRIGELRGMKPQAPQKEEIELIDDESEDESLEKDDSEDDDRDVSEEDINRILFGKK